jgi:hypothetical protein
MQKSESIQKLAKALILFQVKVESIKKDASNPFFKSKYASLSNILDSIKEPLIESGLSVVQLPTGQHELTTIITHESGEYIASTFTMKPVKDDPQGLGSVISYQRRYALSSALLLNVEDDDANHATFGGSTPKDAEENNKPWLNKDTKEFNGAIDKLRAGTTTLEKIRNFYKVSKAVETELLKLSK